LQFNNELVDEFVNESLQFGHMPWVDQNQHETKRYF